MTYLYEPINIGVLPNDGSGDPLRVAFEKINNNFANFTGGSGAADPEASIQFKRVNNLLNVVYFANTWVGITQSGTVFSGASTAGLQQRQTLTDRFTKLAVVNDRVIALGQSGNLAISTDGNTWQTFNTGTSHAIRGITYDTANSTYWAVGDAGTVINSTNLNTWNTVNVGSSQTLHDIVWNGELGSTTGWVIVGSNSTAIISQNGTGWAVSNTGLSNVTLRSVTFTGTGYLAAGDQGKIIYTNSLVSWTDRSPANATSTFNKVVSANINDGTANTRINYVVGSNGTVYRSTGTSATTWTALSTASTSNLYSISFAGNTSAVDANNSPQTIGRWIISGQNGTILSIGAYSNQTQFTDSTMSGTFDGSANLVYQEELGRVFAATDITPQQDITYDIGETELRWRNVYGSSFQLGNGIAITSNANSVRITDSQDASILKNFGANTGNFISINSQSANITDISGVDTISANTIQGSSASYNSITANTGNILNLSSTVFQSNTGTISNLSVSNTLAAYNVTVSNHLVSNTIYAPNAEFDTIMINQGAVFGAEILIQGVITGVFSANSSHQPNITSVGTLTDLTVANAIRANLTGTATNAIHSVNSDHANTANTVVNADQPNITSTGTLTRLSVVGDTTIQGNTTFVGSNITVAANSNIVIDSVLRAYAVVANLQITAPSFIGNLTGTATNAVHANHAITANKVVDAAQPNITSVGTLIDLTVSNTITGNITGRAYVANYADWANNASLADQVTNPNQPNITRVGTLSNLTVAGNVLSNGVYANYLGGSLVTANQPNITTVGTLTHLNVTGNIVANNITSNGNLDVDTVNAGNLWGLIRYPVQKDITQVGNLWELYVVGEANVGDLTVRGNTNLSNFTAANGSFTSLSAGSANIGNLSVTSISGNVRAVGGLGAIQFSGPGEYISGNANLFMVQGSNLYMNGVNSTLTVGYIDGILTANAANQSNITRVGTLNTLSVANFLLLTGNSNTANGDVLRITGGNANIIGKLGVIGNTVLNGSFTVDYPGNINLNTGNLLTRFNVQIPHLDIGANANGGDFTGYSVPDRAVLFHYWNNVANTAGSKNQMAGLIWDTSAKEFVLSTDITRNANLTLVPNDYANLRMGKISANISGDFTGNANITNLTVSGIADLGSVANLRISGGNVNDVLTTVGNGSVQWVPGYTIGGFSNITANGNTMTPMLSNTIIFGTPNVQFFNHTVQTVGINTYVATSNSDTHRLEVRVTPTGIFIDSPFYANMDMSTSGNTLLSDYPTLDNTLEHDTNWLWDLSLNPTAGRIDHDLGTLT